MPRATRHTTPSDTTRAVDEFMDTLEHPHKDAIALLRGIILGVDGSIAEGIKWKAPSFRTSEYFATVNLRARQGVGLILHLGAKVRDLPEGGVSVKDPGGLLDWLAADRATMIFRDVEDLKARRAEVERLLRQWIRVV